MERQRYSKKDLPPNKFRLSTALLNSAVLFCMIMLNNIGGPDGTKDYPLNGFRDLKGKISPKGQGPGNSPFYHKRK